MSKSYSLATNFDAVVMFTWSDWRIEPRSNRYHYATRFAKHLPVLFIQKTDPSSPEQIEQQVDGHDITIIHAGTDYGPAQTRRLNAIFDRHGIKRPLYWVYNPYFYEMITARPGVRVVFHATEDYFAFEKQSGLRILEERDYQTFLKFINLADMAVAVTETVAKSLLENTAFDRPVLRLKNGCDPGPFEAALARSPAPSEKVVIYQGGINARLDFDLIHELVHRLEDWEFWFCGDTSNAIQPIWNTVCSHPNVRAFGAIHPDKIAELQARATVGFIPFRQMDMITASLPLKAYEYVASGLPVVTVPIDELQKRPDIFLTARTSEEFEAHIRAAEATRWSADALMARSAAAHAASYDNRFAELLEQIEAMMTQPQTMLEKEASSAGAVEALAVKASEITRAAGDAKTRSAAKPARLKLLVAYSATATHVQTTLDYLLSLSRNMDADVSYLHATHNAILEIDLNTYDAVFQSYCARWPFEGYVSPFFSEALKKFKGIKLLAVQDEYDRTNMLKAAIAEHGFDVVLTCVPPDQLERVYPRAQFPDTEFLQVLTGYVPEGLSELSAYAMPLEDRPYMIGYRGRDIGGRYGRLAWDKLEIGRRVLAAGEARGLKTDIDWTETRRIYGKNWFKFLGSCRATLGTESGSNVFDFDGSIEVQFNKMKDARGEAPSYEEFLPLVRAQDESMDIGQISPKVFEAAALRTPLILMRGRYSGVVEPGEHYIPLERDYSNLDSVLDQLGDLPELQAMSERAYEHVVASGAFGYPKFAKQVESTVRRKLAERAAAPARRPKVVETIARPLPDIPPDDREILTTRPTESPVSPHEFWRQYEKTQTNLYKREVVRLNQIIASENTRFVDIVQQQSATYMTESARLNDEIVRLNALYAAAVSTASQTYEQQILDARLALERVQLENEQLRELRQADQKSLSEALTAEIANFKDSLTLVSADLRGLLAAHVTAPDTNQAAAPGSVPETPGVQDRLAAIAGALDALGTELETSGVAFPLVDHQLPAPADDLPVDLKLRMSRLRLRARLGASRLRNRLRYSVAFDPAKRAHLWQRVKHRLRYSVAFDPAKRAHLWQRVKRRVRATPGLGHVATWVYHFVKSKPAP